VLVIIIIFIKIEFMINVNYIINVECILNSLTNKIDFISDHITQYRNLTAPSVENLAVQKNPDPGESLFDGTFQNIVHSLNTKIIESSEEELNFNLIIENSSDAVFEINDSAEIIRTNPACSVIFEYKEEELLNKSIYEIISEGYRDDFKLRSREGTLSKFQLKDMKDDDIHVFRGKTKYGNIRTFESFFTSLNIGEKTLKLVVIRDLTYNKSLIDELKKSKDNYAALSDTISEVIIRIDEKFKIIYANYAVKQVLGYEREELLGQNFKLLFPKSEFMRYENEFKKYFYVDFKDRTDMGMKKILEILGKNKNRGISPMEMSFGNAKDISGRTLTCIIRDITNRKNTERKLKHLAFHDTLTDLGNRDLFDTEMKIFFNDLEKKQKLRGALFFLDLDGFKQINDTFGHHAGDELLILTAKRLRNSLRDSDRVYRFGGDEFVILIRSIRNSGEAATIAGNVLNEIRKPYFLHSSPNKPRVNIGVSIGITLLPENGLDIDSATKNADLAMYKAKDSGKNRFIFYSEDLNISAHERWNIEQGMKHAITNGEIQMHYQPIIDENGKVKAVESLIRWFHPVRGYISPDKYIPIAEETGFIITLGNWILERSCRDLKVMNSSVWGKKLYASINLSARQSDHKDLIKNISSVIKRTGVNPNNLRFELTETSIMSAPERVRSIMESLKKVYPGLKFVIDDFGTGYSSLSYLSDLPVDSLKIDLSFVSKLFQSSNQKIVNAIINLAESLDLEVVAEGIEEKVQGEYFINKRCNSLQGFLYSKALSINDLEKYIKKSK
jgi:diguanylate cyclase (GGDEF)-like protein/PAS domain S-box-containing protein